ncbi:MAG: hypothetical protein HDR89_02955 [Bacteroides sp.]|nr:hypothetical protein [Bacteroides sp.]MBD5349832.1 hypothetical protein [Bacteroides sp.]
MGKTKILSFISAAFLLIGISSCNSTKNLIVPHSVSTAEAVPAQALNLTKGDYDIMASVSESASVTVKYSGKSMVVTSGDGDFAYYFSYDKKAGWSLSKFKGTANFGYLLPEGTSYSDMPEAEEFARRVAIARLIEVVKDYGADGVLEPIVTTRATNAGNKIVEYQATVTAKIIKIHTTAN